MRPMIDFATLGPRDAYDFAIMIEEDALLRYGQLADLLGDDPGGAGAVCRSMVKTEWQHRSGLMARRASLFRDAPPRFDDKFTRWRDIGGVRRRLGTWNAPRDVGRRGRGVARAIELRRCDTVTSWHDRHRAIGDRR